ncbi:SDR family oxidoreductase [Blastococcus sp. Marseille-P5729]|uniref:SDR family NAD(P)-dependent oxidoreductase n=1 Tax=Blastococcus sp. Marseille-P5729 TaxID=2086582 RepID=UPI00131AC4EB|nr:SDR family oxidoreductase [Blastococcus sp. Marseille-P5729]
MSQEWQRVLVLGATGMVGSALTRAFAADGAQVHAVGRDDERLRRLAGIDGVRTHQVDLTDADAAERLAGGLAGAGVELAVAAVGGWKVGEPGLELPIHAWRQTIDSHLTAHFVAARSFAPVLAGRRPVYLALNGIASHYPCQGSIAISVTGSGQRMMLDVLAAEGADRLPRYAELVVDTPILLPGQVHDVDEPTHTAQQVYRAVRDLAASSGPAGTVLRRHLG